MIIISFHLKKIIVKTKNKYMNKKIRLSIKNICFFIHFQIIVVFTYIFFLLMLFFHIFL